MAAFAIGALSMIGLPPAAGFVSKWYMLSGAIADAQLVVVAVIAASTLLNAGYFLPVVHRAFFRAPAADDARASARRSAAGRWSSRWLLTAAATIALFFVPTCRWRWRAADAREAR